MRIVLEGGPLDSETREIETASDFYATANSAGFITYRRTDRAQDGNQVYEYSDPAQAVELIGKPEGFGKIALAPEFEQDQPLIWKREADGLKTNVRWKVRHHSPSGFEIGYPGSGPADLALNAMATLFPARGADRVEKCFDGSVSCQAWILHQDFKFKFLAKADRTEGRIEWVEIEAWLADQAK